MEVEALAKLCADAINHPLLPGHPAKITLKLPESPRASHTRYPWGRKGPKGTAVAFGFDGFDTVIFDAVDVLAFLAANGLVKIEGLPAGVPAQPESEISTSENGS